jgi:hypothetical protein
MEWEIGVRELSRTPAVPEGIVEKWGTMSNLSQVLLEAVRRLIRQSPARLRLILSSATAGRA